MFAANRNRRRQSDAAVADIDERAPLLATISGEAAINAILSLPESDESVAAAYAKTLARACPESVQSKTGSIPDWMLIAIRECKPKGRYVFDDKTQRLFHVTPICGGETFLVAGVEFAHGKRIHQIVGVTPDEFCRAVKTHHRVQDFFDHPKATLGAYLMAAPATAPNDLDAAAKAPPSCEAVTSIPRPRPRLRLA